DQVDLATIDATLIVDHLHVGLLGQTDRREPGARAGIRPGLVDLDLAIGHVKPVVLPPGRARLATRPVPIKIARLGGYLARANDPAPGNIVMWRGLSRLTDIELGAHVGAKIVGN